ncbi:hypothetical protein FRC09_019635 [Ceratobasidium sp. 395]|nr:hypothetical protein FRC09_019635 [Ceratobasidium sp. 395]
MAHALFWPLKSSFHPLGDTPAVFLTQDLAPEQSANILLLGCDDPRHILYTLSADIVSLGPRNLDIMCCDLEPAVLARNILLLTLIEAKQDLDYVWDIFYHFKINEESNKILTRQSKTLYDAAETVELWRQSSYGSFCKFLDSRTLAEIRFYWKSYAEFSDLPSERLNKLLVEQSKLSKSVLNKYESNVLPS